ncbi:uncharacterized protein LOC133184907 [Saccostrea echinata]|uniref:uncharacterized protein LOC133184905 n=1 Tax=Saccostrea echinata TaxID=191078 RepID=UPI002A7EB9DC|nr:uncharacterized protein LOC133184905 [Saccostrea echinata]XP_061175961.1 uncharacterized protein LOC133184907 [Saccostrea echinata]
MDFTLKYMQGPSIESDNVLSGSGVNKPKSQRIVLSDSEDEFEDPEKKLKTETPKTSTPVCTPSKVVHVAAIDEDLPMLHSPSKKEKRTSSPGQSSIEKDSEELPDIPLPMTLKDTDASTCTDDEDWTSNLENKVDEDNILKDFEEMMQKKRERQLFAESTFIDFPTKEDVRKNLCVVYECHGGLAINRPFKYGDTVKSVYSWIIQQMDPEILPPVFHLECSSPTSCQNKGCPHIYELGNSYKVKVEELPDVLYLREGCFAVNDTFTGLGDVLI